MNELSDYAFSPLREGDIALYRGSRNGLAPILIVAAEEISLGCIERLKHEYELKCELDVEWAARPVALTRYMDRMVLVLEDPGGVPMDRILGRPLDASHFLRIAIPLSAALSRVHERGLIHKDIKPANILVDAGSGRVWLTGFGIASRLPREHQDPAPPEVIAGTLACMAPEQTGRMNRSVDSRSDLYALGVTFYQMLTGQLPFTAADPMEWVHCHIARQSVPPNERVVGVPGPLSAIVMKLLAKTGEERYQTASGLEADLRRCLEEWKSHGFIQPFPLGTHDPSDRLLIPEKLYGRKGEIDALVAAFDRVVAHGTPELVLVSGYSGIGKSSVVNELHKALVLSRGLFASGKFDQYKRDIPYSTLAQAFQSLIRPLLGKSDPELAGWREAFRDALGSNGQLIIDLVPELELIVGDQPPVPELPPRDRQRRFQLVFRRFLRVFARPDHPLALFLDDLQWLDSATLDLLEDLLTQQDVQHLMLIGAYRDNEVNSAHPLIGRLEAISRAGAVVHKIVLAPLALQDLGLLLADSLHCEPERVTALAELIHQKTAGNPFFAVQLISVLAEEGLLAFDYGEGRWSWDLNRIRAKSHTDNVVDLMVGKLNRLPDETQHALQLLACMGNSAQFAVIAMASQQSTYEMHGQLWEAIRAGLIFRSEHSYTFLHDRIQEAAYSLIPEEARTAAHLRIGRLLAAHIAPEEREEAVFEIVNQLNRGAVFIAAREEREQVAQLNRLAGKRAKASGAYASALNYLTAGAALLPDDAWECWHELSFELELHRAECEFLTGALAEAEQRLIMVSARAATTVERASVACLRADLYTALGQNSRAIDVGLDYLRQAGGEWPRHPTDEDVRCEYDRIFSQLGSRTIDDLVELPLMIAPASLATIDVLMKIGPPAFATEPNLWSLVTCRALDLSLKRGNSDGSCLAYVALGLLAACRFGDYKAAFRFGEIGFELVERLGLKRFQARIYFHFGSHLMPCTRHVRAGRDLVRRAFEIANRNGDLLFAGISSSTLIENMLSTGDALVEVQREAEHSLEFARRIRFDFAIDKIAAQLGLIRTLRGSTMQFGCFDDEQFDESLMERCFSDNPDPGRPEGRYWIRKLQARFFAGEYACAIAASERAQALLWTSPSMFDAADCHFYGALSQAASCPSEGAGQRHQYVGALVAHHRQLEVLASNCPENFDNRAALVGAELARIEGRALDAERLYEKAICSARANGFIHNEALAYELAARFYAARGFKQIADLYLRSARHGYHRWGAVGKVRQLDETYPELRHEDSLPGPTSTIGAPVEHLDLATVLKVSQAVSSEIVLESLIDTLMHIAMEQAGAERVLLIMQRGQAPRIEAEATTNGATVTVRLVDEAVTGRVVPESVLHYVLRTREIVILDDAAADPSYCADSYIRQSQARSILCLPLLNQGTLIGVLYLENNITSRVFAPNRTPVLKLLASQAAIALENAHLYRDVAERETKIRRLVDSNIIGIFIWNFEGRILDANDEFLRMVDYDREDLISGRIRWTDLTPADWREQDSAKIKQHKLSGRLEPFEKEYIKKDGSRVPVLIGVATFEEGGSEGVAFVLDLTDRKHAEEQSRESELKLRQITETVPGLVWSNGPGGEPTHINQRMLDYSGMTFEEFAHRRWEAFVHPADYPETAEAFRHAIQAGVPYEGTMRLRRADGEFRWHNARCEPLRDREGRIIQWYGLCVDINERKKVEDQLRRSEVYLAEAQRLSHTGTAAYNESAILYWSDEIYRIFGFDPREGLPSRNAALERIHPDDRERAREGARKAVEQRKDYSLEFRLLLPDGTVKYTELMAHPKFSAGGELVEVVGTIIDVTAITRAQAALRESERSLRSAIDGIAGLVAVMAPNGELETVNRQVFEYFDRPLEWLKNWGTSDAVHPEDLPRVLAHFNRGLASGNPFNYEQRLRRFDGEYRWFDTRGVPIRDESGRIARWYVLLMDIEDRTRALAQLEQMQSDFAHMNRVSMMGELAASLSHEITQPIASARNYACAAQNFLDMRPPDLGEARKALSCVVGNTDRAGDIIDRIRDHIKNAPPRKEHFDLNEAINEVIVLGRSAILKNGVSVQTRLSEGLLPIHGDRVQLQQVILNLILNAAEAMGSIETEPRELLIGTEQHQTGILVAVRDSGPGIDPRDLERIFEAFYTTKSGGVGMGLSICRSIIGAHGGRLWADVNKPRGAIFQFTLPAPSR